MTEELAQEILDKYNTGKYMYVDLWLQQFSADNILPLINKEVSKVWFENYTPNFLANYQRGESSAYET